MQASTSFQLSSPETSEVALAEYQLVKHLELKSSRTAVTWNSALQLKDKCISAKVCSLDSIFAATTTSRFSQRHTFCRVGELTPGEASRPWCDTERGEVGTLQGRMPPTAPPRTAPLSRPAVLNAPAPSSSSSSSSTHPGKTSLPKDAFPGGPTLPISLHRSEGVPTPGQGNLRDAGVQYQLSLPMAGSPGAGRRHSRPYTAVKAGAFRCVAVADDRSSPFCGMTGLCSHTGVIACLHVPNN